MNAVVYCRVSSKEQVDGTSLESQEIACRDYAARNQMTVMRVFVERGESAKFADRTQLLELLAFCRDKSNAVGALLVWKVDRLARNVGDHFTIKATLLKQGIRVVSVTEPIDTKPEGKLLETILAGFAQFDNDVRAARSVQGMRRKLQEGLFPWQAPLGYRTVTRGQKKTEPDQPVQPAFGILARAWSDFATGEYRKIEILQQATKDGLRTTAGKPLSKQSLDNVLADPFYAGILRDPWSGEEYPGRHQPMVSRATFAKVQELLGKSPVAVPHRHIRVEFPLRAFVRCANCEFPLTGSFSRGRSQTYAYYHCFNRTCDPRGSYAHPIVHREFTRFLYAASSGPDAIRRLKACVARAAAASAEGERMLAESRAIEAGRLRAQQQQLIRMRMEQLVNDEEFVAQRAVLSTRLAEIDPRKEDSRVANAEAVLNSLDRICAPLMDLRAWWNRMPVENQRRFQLIALPAGYVFGRVGTAPRGRLFSLLATLSTTKSHGVPPVGLCWNQLAIEVESMVNIFGVASASTRG
jgi:site-specific DNA recombinase